ncbi:hypothetical protein KIN20_023548 [Parelaphostrongylus tenuis]|uniref:Uncharacterized protein n=1 Tax=Parelaphostrongylus tenuis TaxID=148309 RepID=A0AAD5MX09_PARTN|nr:hypothetical protein KIN20_023548 [Parelaphostrongylus tenuis]
MARLLTTDFLMISVAIITTVLGCGVMPPGQASTRNFTVTGFSLPVSMVYSTEETVRAEAPGIASTKETANSVVNRLVMQTINYDPLECKGATVNKDLSMENKGNKDKQPHCIIVDSTVTSICPERQDMIDCQLNMPGKEFDAVPAKYTMISGTLTVTNIIMANWSRDMWQVY